MTTRVQTHCACHWPQILSNFQKDQPMLSGSCAVSAAVWWRLYRKKSTQVPTFLLGSLGRSEHIVAMKQHTSLVFCVSIVRWTVEVTFSAIMNYPQSFIVTRRTCIHTDRLTGTLLFVISKNYKYYYSRFQLLHYEML